MHIEEIYYIRELIELSSLKFAFEEKNKKYFKRLLIFIKKINNTERDQDFRKKFVQLDTGLHFSIVKSTKNKRLFTIYRRIFNIFLLINLRAHYNDQYYGRIYNHCTNLIQAILDNDFNRSEIALKEHFKISKDFLIKEYINYKSKNNIGEKYSDSSVVSHK